MAKTNYNKMSNKPKEDVKKEVEAVVENTKVTVEAPGTEESAVTETEVAKVGIVTARTLLNIRKGPSTSDDVIGTLPAGQEVIICGEEGEFYKIGNPDGNEFCMKKFISVK